MFFLTMVHGSSAVGLGSKVMIFSGFLVRVVHGVPPREEVFVFPDPA
jgi:hypothetical protein